MDIRFYDESYYLTQGIFHSIQNWNADYSALYSLYYKALHGLTGFGSIELYYANYRVWAFVLALLFFVILISRGLHFGFALIWALCSLSAEINYTLWPKAGHLAMAGLALGLWGIKKLGYKSLGGLIWTTGICLAISWCRPEFFAGFLLGTAMITVGLLFKKMDVRPLSWWVFLPLIFSMIFWNLWGLPVGSSGRGLVAFGQHYVHNWRNLHLKNEGDMMWDWVNWREVFSKDFGPSSHFVEAMMANPKAFFSHLFYNGKQLFYKAFIYFFETLFPNRWLGIPVVYATAILLILLEAFHSFTGLENTWKKMKSYLSFPFSPVYPLLLPSFLAGLLFQPRPHYLIPWFPVFLWLAGDYFQNFSFPGIQQKWKLLVASGLILLTLAFLPDSSAYFTIKKGKADAVKTFPRTFNFFEPVSTEDLRQKELIITLQNMKWPHGLRLFDASTGAIDYLGQRVEQKGKTGFELNYEQISDFEKFVEQDSIQAVFIRPTIRYDRKIQANLYWQKLKSEPEKMGWKKIQIGRFEDSLLIKNEFLEILGLQL